MTGLRRPLQSVSHDFAKRASDGHAKIYAGASLRETRSRAGLTQRAPSPTGWASALSFAEMENNHRRFRPAGVLLRLASEFSVDLGAMAVGDADPHGAGHGRGAG